jgi:hypothetical protein
MLRGAYGYGTCFSKLVSQFHIRFHKPYLWHAIAKSSKSMVFTDQTETVREIETLDFYRFNSVFYSASYPLHWKLMISMISTSYVIQLVLACLGHIELINTNRQPPVLVWVSKPCVVEIFSRKKPLQIGTLRCCMYGGYMPCVSRRPRKTSPVVTGYSWF